MNEIKVEEYSPDYRAISHGGLFVDMRADGENDTAITLGLDFGADTEPAWVVEGRATRTGSRTVLTLEFGSPTPRIVTIDFDHEKRSDGESVDLPVVTVQ